MSAPNPLPSTRVIHADATGELRFSSRERVMIFAPHPDDESLAAAGLILAARSAGAAVHVTYLTDGGNNPWAQLAMEGRWPRTPADRSRWGERRRREAIRALAVLGLDRSDATFLGLPDQGLTPILLGADALALGRVRRSLSRWVPTMVVTPSSLDRHPDHSAAALMVRLALASSGRPEPIRLDYVLHARPHMGPRSRWVRLGRRERALKRAAILCHASQLRWRRFELPRFAREFESFEPAREAGLFEGEHPIGAACVFGEWIHLELQPERADRLGPVVLRVLLEFGCGRVHALGLQLDGRRGLAPVRDARGTLRAQADIRRVRGRLRAAIQLEASPRQCFLKLESPRRQRLGLFDPFGWRAVPVATCLRLMSGTESYLRPLDPVHANGNGASRGREGAAAVPARVSES